MGYGPWGHRESDTTEAIQHTLSVANCRHESYIRSPKPIHLV